MAAIIRTLASQIWHLALGQLQRRYAATRLGLIWAVIQPLATFGVFWAVSVFGLRMGATAGGPPFYALLFCGLACWMTASAAVSGAGGGLLAARHLLVERAIPPVAVVAANVLGALLMHLPLIVIVAAIFLFDGLPATASWLAILYYYVCLGALAFGVSLVLAPFLVRSPDASQGLATILLLWFWGSPIVWQADILPEWLEPWLRINPLFYVAEGYRGALLRDEAFGGPAIYHVVFWVTVVLLASLGTWLFRRFDRRLREWLHR